MNTMLGTPEQLSVLRKADLDMWSPRIKAAGVKL
jgi:hypothetical protein